MARYKKCQGCGEKYIRESWHPPFRTFCSTDCAIVIARARQQKEYRAETRRRKVALKTVSEWTKDVQKLHNRVVRLRDRDEDCPSCGRTNAEVEVTDGWKPGGAWDCGHFLSVGAYPELRFELRNSRKQCKNCNAGSGKYTRKNYTVGKQYREFMVERFGIEEVDWLEGPHEPLNLTVDKLKALKAAYTAMIKELEGR